jgi:hypothetical protein
MKSLELLSSKEQYQVFGECLACLAYFAIETKRCSRAEAESALANATRLHETPLLRKRLNWWNSKLGNIQWAFQDHGLEGTEIHGITLPIKKGRGRKGQAGTQARIRAFAIPLFLHDLPQCQDLARRYLSPGSSLSPAIRAAVLELAPAVVPASAPFANGTNAGIPLTADAAQNEPLESGSPYSPSGVDERERIERQIRARRGQKAFRDALRARYGDRCVVTGCGLLAIVEAAHISPYLGPKDNAPDNGLLLRADIHTLYDLDLVAIEPGTLQVCVHPELPPEYQLFSQQQLKTESAATPSEAALQIRFDRFLKRCRDPAGG